VEPLERWGPAAEALERLAALEHPAAIVRALERPAAAVEERHGRRPVAAALEEALVAAAEALAAPWRGAEREERTRWVVLI
jgi:hypothetical protein